jgi:CelD/BcsL family acetyltransferase involved in cellulose biosynthesis
VTEEKSQPIAWKHAFDDSYEFSDHAAPWPMQTAALDNLQLRVELVSDEPAFDRLAYEWDALLEDSGQQVFFLRFSWNRSWWRYHAPRGAQPYILCCRDASGRLMGLAPLYRRQHRLLGIPYVRELTFLGMGIELKTSEFMDFIARRGHERAIAAAMASFLERRSDWDRIWLHQVPAESRFLGYLMDHYEGRAFSSYCDRAPFVDTRTGWEKYKQSLGRSMRRNVEYYARRLFKQRHCAFGRAATLAEAREALDALVELHQVRWQSAGKPGSFSDPMLHTLLADALRDHFDTGRILLWTLRIDGKIEAALLGFLDNGVLHYFQKGFNPAFAKEDIGTALLGLCLRDSFEDPAINAFDFMGGGATYKELWARHNRTTKTYVFDRFNVRTRLHAARESVLRASATAFRTLAPDSLRAVRRDLINSARARRNARKLRDRALQLLAPVFYYASEVSSLLSTVFEFETCLI